MIILLIDNIINFITVAQTTQWNMIALLYELPVPSISTIVWSILQKIELVENILLALKKKSLV